MKNTTVMIFKDIMELFYTLRDEHPSVLQYVTTILPPWMEAFATHALQKPALVMDSDGQELNEVETGQNQHAKVFALRSINLLVTAFPKEMKPWLTPVLGCVWQDLTALMHLSLDRLEVVDEDSDGEGISSESLIFVILDFIQHVVVKPKFESVLFKEGFFQTMLPCLIHFMQLSDERMELWKSNVNQYIMEEIEADYFSFSIRSSCLDLLEVRLVTFIRAPLLPDENDELQYSNPRSLLTGIQIGDYVSLRTTRSKSCSTGNNEPYSKSVPKLVEDRSCNYCSWFLIVVLEVSRNGSGFFAVIDASSAARIL
jgi:hypothetical protein